MAATELTLRNPASVQMNVLLNGHWGASKPQRSAFMFGCADSPPGCIREVGPASRMLYLILSNVHAPAVLPVRKDKERVQLLTTRSALYDSRFADAALDLFKPFLGALHDRAFEPVARARHPPDGDDEECSHYNDRCVVERV